MSLISGVYFPQKMSWGHLASIKLQFRSPHVLLEQQAIEGACPVVLVPQGGFHRGACPAACCLPSPLSTTLSCGVGPVSGWRGFLKPSICKISRFRYTELSSNTNEIDPRSLGNIVSICMFEIRSMPLFYLVFTLCIFCKYKVEQ